MTLLGCEKIAAKMGLANAQSNTNNSSTAKGIHLNRNRVERAQNGAQPAQVLNASHHSRGRVVEA